MVFKSNIPQPTDILDQSQKDLLGNMQQLDASFGVDHYPFTDVSPNLGKHNKVTTPIISGSAHPVTTTDPVIYAMEDTANLGLLQYTKGANNAFQTPITSLQSPSTPIVLGAGAETSLLDITGIKHITGIVYAIRETAPTASAASRIYTFLYDSALGFTSTPIAGSGTNPELILVGNIIKLKASVAMDIYWSMRIERVLI